MTHNDEEKKMKMMKKKKMNFSFVIFYLINGINDAIEFKIV